MLLCLLLLGISIGALELYASTGNAMQLVVGGLLGIVTTLCSVVGFIPIAGVYLYQVLVDTMFKNLGVSMPILYCYGMILSIIWTAIAIIAVIHVILIVTDKL